MTQEEIENWILLKGQSGERWFEIRIVDPEVQEQELARTLMETLSDFVHQGVQGLAIEESARINH